MLININPPIMNSNNLKQLLIVLICARGLYTSGKYLIEMPKIESLIDGLNVMIFFSCLFPFLIISFSLIIKFFRSINSYQVISDNDYL